MTHPSDIAGLSPIDRIRLALHLSEGYTDREFECEPEYIEALLAQFDSLSARVKELEVENERLRTAIKVDREVDAQSRGEDRRRLNELRRRAEQQRDEAYERAAKVAEQEFSDPNIHPLYRNASAVIAAAIRRLASGPEGGSEGEK